MLLSHTHLNPSNLSGYIINNASLISDPLRISVKKGIFFLFIVIAQGCGQTLGLGLVDKNRIVVNY